MPVPTNRRYPPISGYELGSVIAGGGFSCVFRATNAELRASAACKVVLITPETTPQQRKELEKEIKVHSILKDDNVLEFLAASVVEENGKTRWIPAYYMLMELAAGGDLFDKIAPDVGVDHDMAQHYFNELVSGLGFIHAQGICHRDLKPENLLLSGSGVLKIADFGLCAVWRHKGQERKLAERCGSLPYVAPELSMPDPYRAEPVDVWGAGVVLFTLLFGSTPWDEPTVHSPEFAAFTTGEILSQDPWNRISGDVLNLLLGILTVDPAQRLTLPQVRAHPWCNRASQVPQLGPTALAQRLTRGLQMNGDMELAEPAMQTEDVDMDEDDGGFAMGGAKSQFTQSLMLFSQTQSGMKYTPNLTRFYASISPSQLLTLIAQYLVALGHQVSEDVQEDKRTSGVSIMLRGKDARGLIMAGWIEAEEFSREGLRGSRCVFRRDKGNPLSWRSLWKSVVNCPTVEPYVLKRR
ncbi:CAMK/CAMKL/CHK1 protein kinase [Calocera cornea HHB12733]|uniref:CAMK/CAMKL/CHK1 protein kinase n=1 Tax=Calocera cornea HHB12733 TaxID=1353952 RepID=A0A165DSD3_9BASI|nr:CAMK/CAMKL/CHK1 protein kinase [Calocera cornea HHB12733]